MNFELGPPSPSLSPNSKILYYMDQTEKAHEIIDQLETLLSEKEKAKEQEREKKQQQLTVYNGITIPILKFHSRSPSIPSRDSKSYVPTPQQYSTPRDARTRASAQQSARFVEEMKTRHNDLIQQFKEDSLQQEHKNKEITDQIQELKTELMYSQEKQSITNKEKKQTEQNLEMLENDIERISFQLQKSKDFGQQIQLKLQLLTQDIAEEAYESDEQPQQQKENVEPQPSPINKSRSRSRIKNSTSHRKLMSSLKKEIEFLEAKKEEILNQVSQFDEKAIQEEQIPDEPAHVSVLQIDVDGENQNLDTLDDLRVITESAAQKVEDDVENKQSIQNKKPKQRSCDLCLIF